MDDYDDEDDYHHYDGDCLENAGVIVAKDCDSHT